MARVERNLISTERGEVLPDVIVAVSILTAQAARQWRTDAESRERKQSAIRDFIEAMTESLIGAQHETFPLPCRACLEPPE